MCIRDRSFFRPVISFSFRIALRVRRCSMWSRRADNWKKNSKIVNREESMVDRWPLLLSSYHWFRGTAMIHEFSRFSLSRLFSFLFVLSWIIRVVVLLHEKDRASIKAARVWELESCRLFARLPFCDTCFRSAIVFATRTWTCNAFERTRDFLCDTTRVDRVVQCFKGVFFKVPPNEGIRMRAVVEG